MLPGFEWGCYFSCAVTRALRCRGVCHDLGKVIFRGVYILVQSALKVTLEAIDVQCFMTRAAKSAASQPSVYGVPS